MSTEQKNKIDHSLGIDLGTTLSVVAAHLKGSVVVLEDQTGSRTTPSIVSYRRNSKNLLLCGNLGQSAAASDPQNSPYEFKRLLGKSFVEIAPYTKNWPFKVVETGMEGKTEEERKQAINNIAIMIEQGGVTKQITAIQASAAMLDYLYTGATIKTGGIPAGGVVITVPAYFSERSKKDTDLSAQIAYSNVKYPDGSPCDVKVRLLAEPTAAAMYFAATELKGKVDADKEQLVCVFDLGGGTFDVTLLKISGVGSDSLVGEVVSISGDNQAGGADADKILVEQGVKHYNATYPDAAEFEKKLSAAEKYKGDFRMRNVAISVKKELSVSDSAEFSLQCYRADRNVDFTMSRSKFENLMKPFCSKILQKLEGCLLGYMGAAPVYNDAGHIDQAETNANNRTNKTLRQLAAAAKLEIDHFLFVGGSTRMPIIQKSVKDYMYEGVTDARNRKKMDAMFLRSNVMCPDTAIAAGAAVFANTCFPSTQGGESLGGDILLCDSTPVCLKIGLADDIAHSLIDDKTAVPAIQKQIFSTAVNDQTSIEIVVCEGNSRRTSRNRTIARFQFDGIPKAPRGVPQLEISFKVDEGFCLVVGCVDLARKDSAKEFPVVNLLDHVTPESIEKYKNEAAEHAEAEELYCKRVSMKGEFERYLYQIKEKIEKEASSSDKENVLSEVSKNMDWVDTLTSTVIEGLESSTLESDIKSRTDNLNNLMAPLFPGQSPNGQSPNGQSPNGQSPDGQSPDGQSPDVEELN